MKDYEPPRTGSRLGPIMLIGMWVVVLGLMALFFHGWMERQGSPNQRVQGVITDDGVREVVLSRNRYGHYTATGTINGVPVEFMLDTGASDISIPASVADGLGLERGRAVQYRTANGIITGYSTRLHHVGLGTVEQTNVRASINPFMTGDEVLLGMSFLGELEFTQRDGELTLRQQP